MSPFTVREGGQGRLSGGCVAMAGYAVRIGRRVKVQMAGAAIGGSSPDNGVGTGIGIAKRMAACREAADPVRGAFVGRSREGEGMRYGIADGLDRPVDMFCRVSKAGSRSIDMGMTGDAARRPIGVGMGRSRGRVAVTGSAAGSAQVVGLIPAR